MTLNEFEKTPAISIKTFYPDNASIYETKWSNENSSYKDQTTARKFWSDGWFACMMENPFGKESFWYAEFNHPELGKAIYGCVRNRGFRWQYDTERGLRTSLTWSFGSKEKVNDMIESGFVTLKQGHNVILSD